MFLLKEMDCHDIFKAITLDVYFFYCLQKISWHPHSINRKIGEVYKCIAEDGRKSQKCEKVNLHWRVDLFAYALNN